VNEVRKQEKERGTGMSVEDRSGESARYIIDAESGAEMARLIDQDRAMTEAMGGIFPSIVDIGEVDRILDIGCGPGGWALEVARSLPDTEVVGVDISQRMISYAEAYASVQYIDNVDFMLMDITKPFIFADNEFALVHARMLGTFLHRDMWPVVVKECARVTRPGGLMLWTESDEPGATNSKGFERYKELLLKAMARQGLSQNPLGRNVGATPMLRKHLLAAGYDDIQLVPHVLDFSGGTAAYDLFCGITLSGFKLVQPFLMQWEVAQQEELDELFEQAYLEMKREDFMAILPFITAIGRKRSE
jgi:ubiquinone/menaquinone biosynthesis C-methylase UbiE